MKMNGIVTRLEREKRVLSLVFGAKTLKKKKKGHGVLLFPRGT
jgi:hypothetical protein